MPERLRHYGIPGVVIATVVNGTPSRTYAYGLANVARHEPMRTDTVFRVASISKSLTAWGVLRLAEEGRVDLDGPVERYLHGWPLPKTAFGTSAVTVRSLLSHTSGLNAGVDTFRSPDAPAPSTLALLQRQGPGAAAHPGAARQVAPAGRAFVYSVPGYTLLQLMVETQSGRSFADYMTAAVLRPLGMTSSSFEWDAGLRARTATPYLAEGGASAVVVPEDAAADSLFSTAPDLAKFIAAPLPDLSGPPGGGVLTPTSVDKLYREPVEIPSLRLAELGPDRPALGYFVEQTPGEPTIVTNGGYDPGWSSRLYIVPSTGDGIAILTNSDRAQPLIAQVASIWAAWRGLPPSKMTRAYRTFGVKAAGAISLLVTLGISFACGLVFDLKRRARRRGGLSRPAFVSSLLECTLAAGIATLWWVAYAAVVAMPTLNAVCMGAIGFFALVVLARLVFPVAARPMSAIPA